METTTTPDYPRGLDERDARFEKEFGKPNDRFDEMIEHLATDGLNEKFRTFGFTFNESSREINISKNGQFIAVIDVSLENNDSVMNVIMRFEPDIDDINGHIKRMNKLRSYADGKNDRRTYYGAVGGMIFDENVRDYTLKSGFYVIEPSGNTFDIAAPEGSSQPRAW